MKIVVLGAGAIGSFFGGLLSRKNDVILVGRKNHVDAINNDGLRIKGKTLLKRKINAVETVQEISDSPDLLILTVKAFDTLPAIKQAKEIINPKTIVLSLQNGLNNIEKIKQVVPKNQIIAGVTTHGVQFVKPGVVYHKGIGGLVIGEPSKKITKRIQQIVSCFRNSGISLDISNNILRDIWKKAIVNASINPLTALFQCQNGYLSRNPLLFNIVEKICKESVLVAQKQGFSFEIEEMVQLTKKVISQTEKNVSSMLQSIRQGKSTEICQINGKIAEIGSKYDCNVSLNLLLTKIIKSL